MCCITRPKQTSRTSRTFSSGKVTRLGVPYLFFYQPLFKYYIPKTIPSSRWLRRRALMTRAQRLAGEHCMVDVRPAHALHTLNLAGLVPGASDFVELLRAGRHAALSETSGLARCHGAADELQNGSVCAKHREFKGDIRYTALTMAGVPNWSDQRDAGHSARRFVRAISQACPAPN